VQCWLIIFKSLLWKRRVTGSYGGEVEDISVDESSSDTSTSEV
jgi:hypothetical protein